mgnify:FL=1
MFKQPPWGRGNVHRLVAFLRGMVYALMLSLLLPLAHADDEFLMPEVAFKISARLDDAQTISVTYAIADGYYMYRERFAFTAKGGNAG